MIRPGSPVGAQAVGALNEEKAEEGKEEPCDFEPEDAASVDKGSPYGLADFFCSGHGVFAARGIYGRVLPDGPGGLTGTVAQHSRGDARADTQSAANAIRFHTKSLAAGLIHFRLQPLRIRSKVKGASGRAGAWRIGNGANS
ncbi:MAG: hypothetical protein WA419_15685 [Silvibacterium sp.]